MARKRNIDKITSEKKRWEQGRKVAEGLDLKLPVGPEGLDAAPVYTPSDIPDLDYMRDLGFPGEYPYTRGPYAEMYRLRPFRLSLPAGFGRAEESRDRLDFLMKMGQHGINLFTHMPSQFGVDSDDPSAEDDVGRAGIAFDTMNDMELVYEKVPMSAPYATNWQWGAPIMAAFMVATADKKGFPRTELTGMTMNSPLGEFNCKKSSVLPPKAAVKFCMDWAEFAFKNLPKFQPFQVRTGTTFCKNRGLEPAYNFCEAKVYIDELLKRGLDIDQIGSMMSFGFCVTSPYIFTEVATFRAARRVWAKIMKEEYGAKDPRSWSLRFTAMPLPSWQFREAKELNLVRIAYMGLAAVLAGCQGWYPPTYDEAYSTPTEWGHYLTLGTGLIIYHETDSCKTVDPLGGSYFVEYLTNQVEQEIYQAIKRVEEYGGIIKMLEDGVLQREYLDNAWNFEKDVRSGKRLIVGRNIAHVDEPEVDPPMTKVEPEIVRKQIERLKKIKAERNQTQLKASLERLRKAAESGENTFPSLLDCAKAYASIGEITSVLKDVYGEYKEKDVMV